MLGLQERRAYLPDFQAVLEDGVHSIRLFLRPLQDVRVILGLLLAQGGVGSVIVKLWAISFCWRGKKEKRRMKVKEWDQGKQKITKRCGESGRAPPTQHIDLPLTQWTPLLLH